MRVSDCPYAVGTSEHGDWVRNVFIPTVERERTRIDRGLYGAEAHGRKLVQGYWFDFSDGLRQAMEELRKSLEDIAPLLAGLSFAFKSMTEPDLTRPIIASQRKRRHR